MVLSFQHFRLITLESIMDCNLIYTLHHPRPSIPSPTFSFFIHLLHTPLISILSPYTFYLVILSSPSFPFFTPPLNFINTPPNFPHSNSPPHSLHLHIFIPILSNLLILLYLHHHHHRGLFIIDGKQNLRQATLNDLPVGRSVEEALRLVQAFQFVDKHGEGGWEGGFCSVVMVE